MFRALLVDDHAEFRACVSALLRRRFPQIRVDEVGDGPEALRAIRGCATDLVLMDVRLPSANGIELTRTIKRACASVSVVLLTGYDLPQYRQAAFRNGADCFLYKGSVYCIEDLLARVEGEVMVHRETKDDSPPSPSRE